MAKKADIQYSIVRTKQQIERALTKVKSMEKRVNEDPQYFRKVCLVQLKMAQDNAHSTERLILTSEEMRKRKDEHDYF